MFRYEVQFACLLLEDAFGPVVASCARLLLHHGSLTILELRDLFANSSFSRTSLGSHSTPASRSSCLQTQDVYPLLRNALLVLYQHNLLIVTPIDAPASGPAGLAASMSPPGGSASGSVSSQATNRQLREPLQKKTGTQEGRATPAGEDIDVTKNSTDEPAATAAVSGKDSGSGDKSPCLFEPDEGLETDPAEREESPAAASSERDGLDGRAPQENGISPSLARSSRGAEEETSSSSASAPLSQTSHGMLRYSLALDEVLRRLRYPHFAVYVQKRWGFECRVIFLQVMRAGRQCVQEAVRNALEDPYTHFDVSASCGGNSGPSDTPKNGDPTFNPHTSSSSLTDLSLRRAFLRLISSSLLVQCETALPRKTETEDGSGSNGGLGASPSRHGTGQGKGTRKRPGSVGAGAKTTAGGGKRGKQQKTAEHSDASNGVSFLQHRQEEEEGNGSAAQQNALGIPAYLMNLLAGQTDQAGRTVSVTPDSPGGTGLQARRKGGAEGSSQAQQRLQQRQQMLVERQLFERLQSQRVPFRVNTELLTLELCKEVRAVLLAPGSGGAVPSSKRSVFSTVYSRLPTQVAERFILARVGDNKLARATVRALIEGCVQLVHNRGSPQQAIQADQEASQQGKARLNLFCKWIKFEALEQAVLTNLEKTGVNRQAVERSQLIRLLEALAKHPDRFLQATVHDGQSMYKLNWDELRIVLRRRLVYETVVARCGEKAARVWSLMACKHPFMVGKNCQFWDDQTVADTALLPPQGARRIFYLLAQEGFVRFHESDRLGATATPLSNKHALVVTTSDDTVVLQVLQDFYQTALNLLERKRAEAACLLQLQTNAHTLSPEDTLHLRKREAAEDLLEAHLLAMSEPLMILRDL
ncbi:dna-directed rna polymerase iii polr3c [Cystoisospora suis]|uniref:DNA-directed RNA polymerase III subunit RPC3 n=1 Tax=Cystoisospora suis TaxID=483139 RepID=A0A2C6JND0_9APIC|nr:dna-directed rna polymerase iii polr3c [Cystoisospora suis]